MIRSVIGAVLGAAVALAGVPGTVVAQCGVDVLEEGIQAYRDLELDTAVHILDAVVAGNPSAQCATSNARALTYLGAAHWFSDRPGEAARAFERAVIQAPRFRPDGVEFPPAVTDLFDRVMRSTPSVAPILPDEVEIGPSGEESLLVRLVASTDHPVAITVRSDGMPIRIVYRGTAVAGVHGTHVSWDGRDASGRAIRPGVYELEIVSMDSISQPLRKVVVALSVESDAPAVGARGDHPVAIDSAALERSRPGGGNAWKAIAVGGAGLLGAATIVAAPRAIDGVPESSARYPVAGSLAVAGIVGFVMHLVGGDETDAPFDDGVSDPEQPRAGIPSREPTLLIRRGLQRRVELSRHSAAWSPGR